MFHGVTWGPGLLPVWHLPQRALPLSLQSTLETRRQVWGQRQRRSLPHEGDTPQLLAAPGQDSQRAMSTHRQGWEAASHRAVVCPAHLVLLQVHECCRLNIPPQNSQAESLNPQCDCV